MSLTGWSCPLCQNVCKQQKTNKQKNKKTVKLFIFHSLMDISSTSFQMNPKSLQKDTGD